MSTEFNFNIEKENIENINDNSGLNSTEKSRRSNVDNLKLVATLLINGKKVCETKKIPVEWPKFEAEVKEMF